MSQRVVQALEVIDVHEHERDEGGRPAVGDGGPMVELAAVGEPGERIAHRALLGLVHRARRREPGAEVRDQTL